MLRGRLCREGRESGLCFVCFRCRTPGGKSCQFKPGEVDKGVAQTLARCGRCAVALRCVKNTESACQLQHCRSYNAACTACGELSQPYVPDCFTGDLRRDTSSRVCFHAGCHGANCHRAMLSAQRLCTPHTKLQRMCCSLMTQVIISDSDRLRSAGQRYVPTGTQAASPGSAWYI
jgi:hypothetical protein